MAGVNKVIIICRLGADPELKYMQDGSAVCNFSGATSDVWKDKNTGEKREKTEWHRFVAYRGQAETLAKYLTKGSQIYIEGKLQTRDWEKDGQKHYITEIIVKEFNFLGGGQSNGQNSGGYNQSQGYQQPQNQGGYDQYSYNSGREFSTPPEEDD